MAENFQQNIDALFKGMEDMITSKTVVGEPVHVGETVIIPLMDVQFGVMASSKAQPQSHNAGGGLGGKMSPSAVLVIRNGNTRLINVKNQDGLTKILDMIPELVNRAKGDKQPEDPGVKEAVKDAEEKTEKF